MGLFGAVVIVEITCVCSDGHNPPNVVSLFRSTRFVLQKVIRNLNSFTYFTSIHQHIPVWWLVIQFFKSNLGMHLIKFTGMRLITKGSGNSGVHPCWPCAVSSMYFATFINRHVTRCKTVTPGGLAMCVHRVSCYTQNNEATQPQPTPTCTCTSAWTWCRALVWKFKMIGPDNSRRCAALVYRGNMKENDSPFMSHFGDCLGKFARMGGVAFFIHCHTRFKMISDLTYCITKKYSVVTHELCLEIECNVWYIY